MGGANGKSKKKKSPRDGKSGGKSANYKKTGMKGGMSGDNATNKNTNGKSSTTRGALETQIESALTHISYDRIEQGLLELKDICKKNSTNVDALETYAYALAEYGDQEEALDALRDAAKANPDSGYEKFMYLGQMLDDGKAATACTKKG